MSSNFAHRLPFGAEVTGIGETRFRVWAPSVSDVSLLLDDNRTLPMSGAAGGWFELSANVAAGARYRYRMPDGTAVPDPVSRRQDGDVHGWSVVVDPNAFEWRNPEWRGRPWHEAVIYEVHPGLAGGFAGITGDLERLKALGVTVVELMPIADFPGTRNWGYDGVLPYAPDESYGTVEELKTMIDRAHGLGMMVMLDVVYNHFGPDGAYLHVFAKEFFEADKHSPWGAAIDFGRAEVRDYFTQNALYWLHEYRFDGLRFDAVHAISEQSYLQELSRTLRDSAGDGRFVHLVLENEHNASSLIGGGADFDAQWADDFHHCVHVLLTGEQEGYYEDYDGPADMLATALSEGFVYQGQVSPRGKSRGEASGHLAPTAFVACLQNHDQIGNRALGERLTLLTRPAALEAATVLLLLSPQIPLIFMGEEVGTQAPFFFFTDHNDELAELVRQGRRKEFAHFSAFSDTMRRDMIPDPNAPSTYETSRVERHPRDPDRTRLYETLLGIRAREIMPRIPGAASAGAQAIGTAAVIAAWTMGDGATLTIAANLGHEPAEITAPDGRVLFATQPVVETSIRDGSLPPSSAAAFLQD